MYIYIYTYSLIITEQKIAEVGISVGYILVFM